ncbi:unnamed protein product [Ilex paraguariensis]|uniref:FAD-binding PCMH-type domain-containing protein n=1 Tax=Ilex paraguariensis TaxID=185542 RepID=A0ABC8SZ24_9AQUA
MLKMITSRASLLLLCFLFLSSLSWAASAHANEAFLSCLSSQLQNSTNISQVIYTPSNPSYLSVLNFSAQNFRFTTLDTPRPLVIITPLQESHIQITVNCCRKYDIEIRIRSGGHDYEGLSYVAQVPFAIIDLRNMSSVSVDVEEKTAWIQAGATLGQVYYYIANKSSTLAFPAGICPSVGVGGHFSGGGYGMLMRKFGLAADHIIDARLIDVNGRILNRKSMGKDLFWAIRGGGSASFGVISAWKVNLITVPETVTVFRINKTLEQNATTLVHQWQYIAPKIDENLFIRVFLSNVNSSIDGNKTIQASFTALFVGGVDDLLSLMQDNFSELGLVQENCIELTWIESVLNLFGGESVNNLLNREFPFKSNYKLKSDYVKVPISESVFEGIWEILYEEEINVVLMVLNPYGGVMSKISESKIPFPHRAGNLYHIEYQIVWAEEGTTASERHINWIRRLYKYMTPYVSMNPREAYINYRDLDIGVNNEGNTSYAQAGVWGTKYYKKNFNRLVKVKTLVDPSNFFRNEQSIPPKFLPWIQRIGDHSPMGKDIM